MLRLDGDCLGVAVAELEGHCAVDANGAFVEQGDTEVGTKDQLVDAEFGGFLPVVTVGGQSVVLDLGDHGSVLRQQRLVLLVACVECLLVDLLVLSDSRVVGDHRLELFGHLVDLSEKPGGSSLQVTRVE